MAFMASIARSAPSASGRCCPRMPTYGSKRPRARIASRRLCTLLREAPNSSSLVLARRPFFLRCFMADHNFRRKDEKDLFAGRLGIGAPCGERFMRLGLLHGRYAMEHAG